MRVPDAIRNCVVFIGVENESRNISFKGTGFLVSLKSEKFANSAFVYFVTARHVQVKLAGKEFYIRANTKDGKAFVIRLSGDSKWWFHPDETTSCDVAVIPALLRQKIFELLDYSAISTEMILTDSLRLSENIGVGDDVFMVGLFAYHSGTGKNLPIVRMGNIAMIPDEPVPTSTFGDLEVYLIESRSIGGLSGSPVFVVKEITLGHWRFYLLGLIHGHWDIDTVELIDATIEDGKTQGGINVGIAMVSPAKKILEILMQKGLQELRDAQEKAHAV